MMYTTEMLPAGQMQAGRQVNLSRAGRVQPRLPPRRAFIQSKENVYRSTSLHSYEEEHHWYDLGDASKRFLIKLAGAAAAATLLTCAPSSPAHAEVQTVAPSQLTQLAKPLPQQEVNKGRIWGVFVGGAVVLFVTTVVAENNEAWFPAISRANKAMAMSRAQAQKAEQRAEAQEREVSEVARQSKLVEAGLREAASKQRQSAPAQQQQQPGQQQQQPVASQPSQQQPSLTSTSGVPEPPAQPQQQPVQHNVPPVLSSQDSNGAGSVSSPAVASTQQQHEGYSGPSASTSSQSLSESQGLEQSPLQSAAVMGAAAAVANASKAARLEGFVGTMTGAKEALRSLKSSIPPRQ